MEKTPTQPKGPGLGGQSFGKPKSQGPGAAQPKDPSNGSIG